MRKTAKVLDISGVFSDTPDFPVAVVREYADDQPISEDMFGDRIIDPVIDWHVTRNLFGRVMTLVEATCDTHKLKAVKDLFAKELSAWERDVFDSAREIADGGGSSSNIYMKDTFKIKE